MTPFPEEVFRIGAFGVTDVELVSTLLALLIVVGLRLGMAFGSSREVLEVVYELLDDTIRKMTSADVGALVPLVLTQWVFIGLANLVGLVPGVLSPTRDLSLAAALAAISFTAGHVVAFRQHGLRHLRHYLEPNALLLPFNVIGEISRTAALALRLFGNMLSGTLVGAIFVYLAGFLVPVPLMLLSALTAVVQAYIFGVLTLVFAASSLETADHRSSRAAISKERNP